MIRPFITTTSIETQRAGSIVETLKMLKLLFVDTCTLMPLRNSHRSRTSLSHVGSAAYRNVLRNHLWIGLCPVPTLSEPVGPSSSHFGLLIGDCFVVVVVLLLLYSVVFGTQSRRSQTLLFKDKPLCRGSAAYRKFLLNLCGSECVQCPRCPIR